MTRSTAFFGKVLLGVFGYCLYPNTLQANPDSLLNLRIERATQLFGTNPTEALQILQAAANSSEFAAATCTTRGTLYHKTGVCLFRLKSYREALGYFRDQALPLRVSCLGPNHLETANTTYNVAMMYRNLDNPTAEADYLRRSIGILEKLPSTPAADNYLSRNYKEAAELLRRQGDLATAKRYLLGARKLLEKANLFQGKDKALWLHRWGTLHTDLKDYREALGAFQTSYDTYQATDATTFRLDMANCHHEMGRVHYFLSDYAQAALFCEKAMQVYAATTGETLNLSMGHELMGNIQKRKQQYRKALRSFKRSLALRQQGGHDKAIANAWENMGDVYIAMGQMAKGLESYKKGARSPVKTDAIRAGLLRADALHKAGLAKNDPATLKEALQLYTVVDSIATELRLFYQGHESKTALLANVQSFYEAAIGTAYTLSQGNSQNAAAQLENAYRFCAKNKAVLLMDAMGELEARTLGLPDSLVEKERSLRQNCQRLLSLGAPEFDLERIRYQHFIQYLEQEYPTYHQLKHRPFQLLPSSEIQQALAQDAALVEYFVGVEYLYTFLITPQNGLSVFRQRLPANFAAACLQLRAIAENIDAAQGLSNYPTPANLAWEILLKQVLAALPPTAKRLCIVPHGILQGLPFDILPTQPVTAWQGAQTPLLLKQFALSQTFSSQWLIQQYQRKKNAAPQTAIFGGFGLEYDDETLKALLDAGVPTDTAIFKRNIGKLHFSDDEVQESADLLGGTAWLNKSATKAHFLENFNRYRIVHLAMHGLLNAKTPMQSALVFSHSQDAPDFKLHLAEIFGLQIPAQLVVLSACNTYDGPSVPGEGLHSLALAFAHAGCPSIIANQWSASDQASKELLLAFYKYLKQGLSKDQALQQAKLDYVNNAMPTFAQPSYWANLVLIGDASQIFVPEDALSAAAPVAASGFSRWWLILIALLAVGAGVLAKKGKGAQKV